MDADEAALLEVRDVGPGARAEHSRSFFAEPHNREVIAAAARRRRTLAGDARRSARRRARSPA